MPNEFVDILESIVGVGINAFTRYDMTFYHNSFPGHEIEKWMVLYAERFRNPVFKSFQSELEVVFEGKNRAMDNFEVHVTDEIRNYIFSNLPYGKWSILGSVAHLKKPSIS